MAISRKNLITRHDVTYSSEAGAPLSVGNGAFCFTAGWTGLQSFSGNYAAGGFPLCTMAEWGWHSYPGAPQDEAGLRLDPFDTYGRPVGYAVDGAGQETLFKDLRQNAHKFHLGKIAFTWDGAEPGDGLFHPVEQRLSLWEGTLYSSFTVGEPGEKVSVTVFVHPHEDTVYVSARSVLFKTGRLGLSLEFPYGSHKKAAGDFSAHAAHVTELAEESAGLLRLRRLMDSTRYQVTVTSVPSAACHYRGADHRVCFSPSQEEVFFAFSFSPNAGAVPVLPAKLPPEPFETARAKCLRFWEDYWTGGAAIDFSAATNPQAQELERRLVLSQYLTAIQCRGKLPPAETGLTFNSWYGKFHLEMHYWHTAHFALWGRRKELEKSLAYYLEILDRAKAIAQAQGYKGARWPKMCDPSGHNSPSSIAVLLLWQQPHPILLAELCYRSLCTAGKADEAATFLKKYREVVIESAVFMRDFIHWEEAQQRFVLGPPYIPAQERHDPRLVLNAAYELEYFRWGFKTANTWLERLGEGPRQDFTEAAKKLARPAIKDGLYLAHENCPDTFTALPFYTDHPSMLAMLGLLPGEGIDRTVMNATLDMVLEVWDRQSLWGWDFPMMALNAGALGRKKDAAALLLLDSPKNTYLSNGHNQQTGAEDLPLYLPGNGGLLLAVAILAKKGLLPDDFRCETEGLEEYIC
jgi:hypothetical protein